MNCTAVAPSPAHSFSVVSFNRDLGPISKGSKVVFTPVAEPKTGVLLLCEEGEVRFIDPQSPGLLHSIDRAKAPVPLSQSVIYGLAVAIMAGDDIDYRPGGISA